MKLRYARRARTDIDGIHEYIAQHDKRAASAVVRRIRGAAQLLAKYPGLGRATDMADARVFPIAPFPYLIYYRLTDDTLEVVHVRHGRRDAPKPSELG
ncbi:type II toxin-antitoxin system RelE/ParE family toxin [Bradyrhizobium guangdongense]|uniref:type II toxin-antitoxin system RelE/ParE family toxin n=1 Tax=Bradyrhizobium guangdongense TaxID=1325090 RepID=UPI0016427512|nr:type II toxin-antitoxin system RelE/ParE family toxin [Bradyrhizobium guangdongense]